MDDPHALDHFLGEALSTRQAFTMGCTTLFCLGIQRVVPIVFPQILNLPASKARAGVPVFVVSMLHALLVSGLSLWTLLLPDESVSEDPFYGRSARIQLAFGIAAGFFMYDLIVVLFVEGQFDVGFFGHAITCFLVYLFGQRPFLPWMGSVCLLFELSTPFLNAHHILSAFSRPKDHRTILALRVLFAATFIIVRIFVGIPMSMIWFRDMISRMMAGTLHSQSIGFFYLFANLALNALNVFWTYKIIRRALRATAPNKTTTVDKKD